LKTKNIIVNYGFKEGADVLGSGDSIFYDEIGVPKGIIFRVDVAGTSLPVTIGGVFGKNHVYAALAALAFSSGMKFNMLESANALKNYDVPPGRMRLLSGVKDTLLIDDTYNSSPFACAAALKTLGEIKGSGRKIAILGDMLELGKHTEEAHRNIGKIAREHADILIVVGPRAQGIKEGAFSEGMKEKNIHEFSDSSAAAEFMQTFIKEKDFMLVKGSQGMRMERVTAALLLDQENKNKLLVRQDREWLDKK